MHHSSKALTAILAALSSGLAWAAADSSVQVYGVLDTGVYIHHASNGSTVTEMASGITKGSRWGCLLD